MKMIKLLFFFFLSFSYVFGQNDGVKTAEAKYAIETAHDCNASAKALQEVSPRGRNSMLFKLYAAKTFDCLSQYDSALIYYTKYIAIVPNDDDALKKVAELSYKINAKKNCSLCHGKGEYYKDVECNYCKLGWKNCLTCEGTGEMNCGYCKRSPGSCRSCDGTGYVYDMRCSICKGNGKCKYCQGRKKVECYTCKGTRGDKCIICKGSGRNQVLTICQH